MNLKRRGFLFGSLASAFAAICGRKAEGKQDSPLSARAIIALSKPTQEWFGVYNDGPYFNHSSMCRTERELMNLGAQRGYAVAKTRFTDNGGVITFSDYCGEEWSCLR